MDFKDEMIACKNLPQYILKKSFITKIIAFVIYFHILPIKTIITDIIYSTNADYLPDIEEIEQFPKLLFISEKMTKSFLTRIHRNNENV